ncbi:MAG: helix-turn-helix domain-containing protein [Chloroflexi bacterium]|nr:helix-turn-helix domain-containing protein [Chloroflexota bacterium]
MDREEYLTPEEVASLFRVTPQTVLNWVRAGRLAGVQPSPRVVRIPRVEVERVKRARKPIPKDLLEPRPWREVLREYEHHFGLSTEDLLRLQAEGRVLELRTAQDERMYEAWLGAARLAVATGLLAVPKATHRA